MFFTLFLCRTCGEEGGGSGLFLSFNASCGITSKDPDYVSYWMVVEILRVDCLPWYKYWLFVHWTIFTYLKHILHKNVCCLVYDGLPGLSEVGRFLLSTYNIIKFTLTRDNFGSFRSPHRYKAKCFYHNRDFIRLCCCMTMQDHTLLAQRLMLWRRWSLRFSPIRPRALTWRQTISISFLTSRGISRGLISPQMMKWSKLWRRGSKNWILHWRHA